MARSRKNYRRRRYKPLTRVSARKTFLGFVSKIDRQPSRRIPLIRRNRDKIRKEGFLRRLRVLREKGRRARLKKSLVSSPTPSFTSFSHEKTKICHNRAVRKEILHALNKTGKTGQKKPIRRHPGVICRRK